MFERTNGAVKLVALPDAQETSDVPCDTGSNPEVLRKELIEEKDAPVDLGLLTPEWNVKVFFPPGVCGKGITLVNCCYRKVATLPPTKRLNTVLARPGDG